jgi:hypothetical protein
MEQLPNRRAACELMRRLKPMADEVLSRASVTNSHDLPLGDPAPVAPPRAPHFSLDHIPILAFDDVNTPTRPEAGSSCVSFVGGIFFDDQQAGSSPSRLEG